MLSSTSYSSHATASSRNFCKSRWTDIATNFPILSVGRYYPKYSAASKSRPIKWAPGGPDTDVHEHTRQFWDKRGYALSECECAIAIRNMGGFIMLLDTWDRRLQAEKNIHSKKSHH